MRTVSMMKWILLILLASERYAADQENFSEFRTSELACSIGNNAATNGHRAGYNGIFSLTSVHQSKSLFVPAYAGINLEHIFHSTIDRNVREEFFEPRNAPMVFERIDRTTAKLHQPPTPLTQVESITQFTLLDPHYIDIEFRCISHTDRFSGKPLGFFWASYINGPIDKSMYFLTGNSTLDNPAWQQFCTQYHNHDSTVLWQNDTFRWEFEPAMLNQTLFFSFSKITYSQPFFYGRFENMVWIVMFADPEGIRFAHSPSGGGSNPDLNDTNPAWDFQWIIPSVQPGKEYSTRFRAVYKPWINRQDVIHEYRHYLDSFK